MGYLSGALSDALKTIGCKQSELAQQTGLPASQINRYLRGRNRVPPENFEKILSAVPAEHHGRLAVAYLRDLMPADYQATVNIEPVENRVREGEWVPCLPGIDQDLDQLLRLYSRLATQHTEVRDMLRSFAVAIGAIPKPKA